MRRVATAGLVAGVLILVGVGAASGEDTPGPVQVIEVSGFIDPVIVTFVERKLDAAVRDGAEALVVQLDSPGVVVGPDTYQALLDRVRQSPVPVGVWIGPSGAQASRAAGRLAQAAPIAAISPGSTIEIGGARLRAQDAVRRGVLELDAPTIGQFIVELDGRELQGRTLHTARVVSTDAGPRREPLQVSFAKLGLLEQLMHAAASPPIAYLLLTAGLALLVFELYTAGIGIAGGVGAGALLLAAYGLGVLPIWWPALVLLVLATAGFAVDVQTGVPRFWTAIGVVGYSAGSALLFTDEVGRPWLALVVGVAGMVLMMLAGLPATVRSRFSTPTIGRESMIGEMGEAAAAVRPEGVVRVRGALWRARTNRATPIGEGEPVRVVGIDGLLLEVEPETGGARDYRR